MTEMQSEYVTQIKRKGQHKLFESFGKHSERMKHTLSLKLYLLNTF